MEVFSHFLTPPPPPPKEKRKNFFAHQIIIYTLFFWDDPEVEPHNEPKFVVFYSMLLSLFTIICFSCKESKPKVSMKQNCTMVTVSQHCNICGKDAFQWRSQPLAFGRYPAGNLLLSFATLMAGASIIKVLLIF